jgi:hypothetical protein
MKILAIIFVVFVMTGCGVNDEFSPSKEYCEMWKVWHDSDSEYGWPDPNNVYDEECK